MAVAAIEENDMVLLIDTGTLKIDRKIKMKGRTRNAVFSLDGKWLYVSAEEADSVDVVDLTKNEVVKSVKVGDAARHRIPARRQPCVCRGGEYDTVNVFDTATPKSPRGSRRAAVPPRPCAPDGKRVFVTSGGKGTAK
jgi:DNA-binding beta-propeller fold protein YncE